LFPNNQELVCAISRPGWNGQPARRPPFPYPFNAKLNYCSGPIFVKNSR